MSEQHTAKMAGYVRVSRVMGRDGPGYISPSVQQDAITKWAEYKGVDISEWLIDEDQSGGTQDRPELKRGIELALSGEVDGIISWKIDRFSRTTEGGLRDLRRLEAADSRLAFVVEDIDTGTTYGKMVYTILLAVSEAFLENIKAGWSETKRRAVKRGAYASPTPYGYQRNPDSTLRPHPEQAKHVTEAFRLASSSRDIGSAMAYLIANAPQRRWTATTVRRLLSKRSYLGETRNGDLVQKDTHEPLVTKAIWEAAQSTPTGRRSSDDFPLSGILRCATCSNPMTGSRGGKGQRTYRCAATSGGYVGTKCPKGTVVTAERIETYVHEQTLGLLSGLQATISDPDGDMLDQLEDDINDAEAELEAFASDLTLRRALGDRYHSQLDLRSSAVTKARDAYRDLARHSATQVTLTADDIIDDPELLPTVLRSLFDAIVISPGRGIKIDARTRFVPLDADSSSGVSLAQAAK